MTNSRQKWLAWALIFLGGTAIGFLVGGYGGSQFGISLILNSTLQKESTDLQIQLEALSLIRQQQLTEAVELLETSVDDQLVVFDPREPYPGLRDEVEAGLDAAIRAAFEYRQRYPRSTGKAADAMVENLFRRKGLLP